jgi:hypothetical protein
MRTSRNHDVEQKIEVVKNALGKQDQKTFELRWPSDLDEGHQVDALILCLIQQCAYAASIVFHPPHSAQVLQGAANHPRYGRNGFQNHCTVAITMCKEDIRKEPQ